MQRLTYACGALLLGLSLATAGCAPGPKTEQPGGSQDQTGQVQTFDDLLQADKLVMTTKIDSDLPRSWTYSGEELKPKVEKLVSVLKAEATELPASEAANQSKTAPMVFMIFTVKGEKFGINVYNDRFEFGGKGWYSLPSAPERTYGSINELKPANE